MLKTIFAEENKADAEAQWEAVADALVSVMNFVYLFWPMRFSDTVTH